MINKEVREDLDFSAEGAKLFDNPSYDNSIIGTTTDGRIVYNYDMMIVEYSDDNNCSFEEAREFIDYNTIRALDYMSDDKLPIVMYPLALKVEG